MLKIHVPKIEKFEIQRNKGEINHIIKDGIQKNEKTVLVENGDDADFIFLDFRHLNRKSGFEGEIIERWLHKIVVIDYSDNHHLLNIDSKNYFKRSIVDKKHKSFFKYNREVHPISYCIKNDCLNFPINFENREIDISIFFRKSNESPKPGMKNRSIVAEFIANTYKHRVTFVGIAGNDGEKGRMGENNKSYYEIMMNSKIVVTCNPDNWEGDYRLFESLSCGPLVMVDDMITPVTNKFINNNHLIYYNNLYQLKYNIDYYLNNEHERRKISKSGYEHAMKFHKTSDRIDEILKIIT